VLYVPISGDMAGLQDDTTRGDAEGTMAGAIDRQQRFGDGRKQPTEVEVSPVTGETRLPSNEQSATIGNRQSWTISTGRNKTFSSVQATSWSIEAAVEVMSGDAFILTRGNVVPVIDKERLLAHLKVVTQIFDTDQGIARAREAAKDFEFPPEVVTRDQEVMDATGSLSAVIEAVQNRGLKERFNADRVERCIPKSYVQYDMLRDIAANGAPIDLPEGFVPSGQPEEPRVMLRQIPLLGDAEACTQSMGTEPWRIDSLVHVTRVREGASAFQSVPLEQGEDLGAMAHRLFQPCRGFQP
jgi:hypothetical protein